MGDDQEQNQQPTIEDRLAKLEEGVPVTYEQKVAEIKRDFAILVEKLHSHGIHVNLNPEVAEGEEV